MAACAVCVLSRCNLLNGSLLKVQKVPLMLRSTGQRYIPTTSTQCKRLKGSAQCMTSAQWIYEFKAAEDMKRREIAKKEERRRKRKAAQEENAALERMKAIIKSGGRAQCCTPSLPNAHEDV